MSDSNLTLEEKKARLRALLERQKAAKHQQSSSSLIATQRDREKEVLSFAQQRMWLVNKLEQGSGNYNMPIVLKFEGQFDSERFLQSLNQIIDKHEILRTVYRVEGNTPWQFITQCRLEQISEVDIRELPAKEKEQKLKELVRDYACMAFDLEKDLMLRAHLIQVSELQTVAVIVLHHIACDGWSMEILREEFVQHYLGTRVQRSAQVEQVQYADYTLWQQAQLDSEQTQKSLAYWETQLAGAPVTHGLPVIGKNKGSGQGRKHTAELSAGVCQSIEQVAQKFNLTPFMVFHGALSMLLAKNSNEQDIVVGMPSANRSSTQLESVIGFFVNTLVLRTNTGCDSIADFFEHVRNVHMDAQQHQQIPFDMLIDKLNVPRSTDITPLFQIMISQQARFGLSDLAANSVVQADNVTISAMESDVALAKFDLEVTLSFDKTGGAVEWLYDAARLDSELVQSLSHQLVKVIDFIGEHVSELAKLNLASLNLYSPDELQTLLLDCNKAQRMDAESICFQEIFESFVVNNASAPALSVGEQHLSYQQLNDKANQFARYLLSNHQVTPDTPIGIYIERSVDMVVAILAVIKSGAAYVPIDASLPVDRIANIIEQCALDVMVTSGQTQEATEKLPVSTIRIDDVAVQQQLIHQSTSNISPAELGLSASNLAYIIFTSGSTGVPKGVMVEHKALCAFTTAKNFVDVERITCIASVSSHAFDGFVFDLFFALGNGKHCVVYDKELYLNFSQFNHALKRDQVDTIFVTTALFNLYNQHQSFKDTAIKQVLFGGEKCDLATVESFKQSYPETSLTHVYGPTETIVYATYCDLQAYRDQAPIGQALDNNLLIVLDENKQPVPRGAVGELHITGTSLARGYINNETLTAEKFINNPYKQLFADIQGCEKLYCTGDMVYQLPNGDIEFVGRNDDQVKIRGFRIELSEIEAHLSQIDAITNAVVIAHGESANKELIAYVDLANAAEQEEYGQAASQIQAFLSERVPSYMVPSAFGFVQSWPLNQNGKVDKSKLVQVELVKPADKFVPAQSEVEMTIQAIWAELLNRPAEEISIHSDFFALGGNSLLASNLQLKINQAFSMNIALSEVFDKPSISQISSMIEHILVLSTQDQVAQEVASQEYEEFSL
ncbi:non-ribosomal peptide synthetase [Pseudoalteromonas luteoviolacea]|uniref:Carrier domain-containing protein n=1 Tax=Pseudoalteromonas luteoviolacea S4060-1 TaxID=1365257 RepID=A0A167J542_9GAMM|nr:non-ribosomal peptide synthetase [Pseudoalteromonas luteoviolacea]KZN60468.1 hypothetical protein N478_26195 [Pseudoalteromonas luteoviolacea S4060-1]